MWRLFPPSPPPNIDRAVYSRLLSPAGSNEIRPKVLECRWRRKRVPVWRRGVTWQGATMTMTRAACPSPTRGLYKSTPHRIGRPLCLENPRPKGRMHLPGKMAQGSTHRHRAFAMWLPLARQSGPLTRNDQNASKAATTSGGQASASGGSPAGWSPPNRAFAQTHRAPNAVAPVCSPAQAVS